MPTPKKGPRFGRDPAHQRLIMANLAAHLFEAGHHRHDAAAGQGAPSVRREPHHQGEARGYAPAAARDRADPRPERRAQAVRRDRSPLRRPQWWLPAHPEAGSAPRRQRAHGAHRTGVSQLSLGEASPARERLTLAATEVGCCVRRHRLSRVRGPARPAHGRRSAYCVLKRVLGHDVQLSCAGRTDAGVHAWARWSVARSTPSTDPAVLHARSTVTSPPRSSSAAPSSSMTPSTPVARHSGVPTGTRSFAVHAPDPFRARYAWWLPEALDLARMRLASDPFLGEHDSRAFCRSGQPASTTVRRVLASEWRDEGDGLLVTRSGPTAFCWQMVRSIVGTLADVGIGKSGRATSWRSCGPGTGTRPGRLAPPTGCASGTWVPSW